MSGDALVLFSGGLDSTTTLVWALSEFSTVHTITFNLVEGKSPELLNVNKLIDSVYETFPQHSHRRGKHFLVGVDFPSGALLGGGDVPFIIPARNSTFLSIASNVATTLGVKTLVIGVCKSDSDSYPDCGIHFLESMGESLTRAVGSEVTIRAPLIHLDKVGVWKLVKSLGGDDLVGFMVDKTITCYLNVKGEKNIWGYGCGECSACLQRYYGFLGLVSEDNDEKGV